MANLRDGPSRGMDFACSKGNLREITYRQAWLGGDEEAGFGAAIALRS
jgi:hypothetical protein